MENNIQQKRQSSDLLMILLILVGLAGGYIYYSQVGSSGAEDLPPPPKDTLAVFKDIVLDFEVLQRAEFKNLKLFGESPVKLEPGGKANLFAP